MMLTSLFKRLFRSQNGGGGSVFKHSGGGSGGGGGSGRRQSRDFDDDLEAFSSDMLDQDSQLDQDAQLLEPAKKEQPQRLAELAASATRKKQPKTHREKHSARQIGAASSLTPLKKGLRAPGCGGVGKPITGEGSTSSSNTSSSTTSSSSNGSTLESTGSSSSYTTSSSSSTNADNENAEKDDEKTLAPKRDRMGVAEKGDCPTALNSPLVYPQEAPTAAEAATTTAEEEATCVAAIADNDQDDDYFDDDDFFGDEGDDNRVAFIAEASQQQRHHHYHHCQIGSAAATPSTLAANSSGASGTGASTTTQSALGGLATSTSTSTPITTTNSPTVATTPAATALQPPRKTDVDQLLTGAQASQQRRDSVRGNLEELRVAESVNYRPVVYKYSFRIHDSPANMRVFTDPDDRRIEAIARSCDSQIHLEKLPMRFGGGTFGSVGGVTGQSSLKMRRVTIQSPDLHSLEKCCRQFDDRFPHFYVSGGLGLSGKSIQRVYVDELEQQE